MVRRRNMWIPLDATACHRTLSVMTRSVYFFYGSGSPVAVATV